MLKNRIHVSIALATLLLAGNVMAQSTVPATPFKGAGATSPALFIHTLLARYNREVGVSINYLPVGTFEGINALTTHSVDFAISDLDLADIDISSQTDYVDVPIAVTAIAIVVNLPEVEIVKLTPELVSDIFSGKITSWQDVRIQSVNQRVKLPNRPIQLILRGDQSGTTKTLSRYLRLTNPNFDWGIDRVTHVSGNQAVVSALEKIPGAIGFTEWHYAAQAGISMAALQNRKGRYTTPTLSSVQSALQGATVETIRTIGTQSNDEFAYPIVGFSWLITPKNQERHGSYTRARQLTDFVWWSTHQGQLFADQYGFPPLPEVAMRYATKQLKELQYDDIIIR